MQTEDQTIESAEAALTDDQIAALIADAPAENPAAFVPTDAGGVDWVLAKIAAYRVEAALIRENMGIMARTCDRKAEALLWKYNAPLQTYLRGELEGGKGKEKSKRLPHGLIGFRTPPVSVQVTSPAAVMGLGTGEPRGRHCH